MVANLAKTTAILSSFWFGDILMHIVWLLPSTEGSCLVPLLGPETNCTMQKIVCTSLIALVNSIQLVHT